jgi:hypothetical protein
MSIVRLFVNENGFRKSTLLAQAKASSRMNIWADQEGRISKVTIYEKERHIFLSLAVVIGRC